VKIIVDSRRPIVTYTETQKDAIAQRIEEINKFPYLTLSQIENLIKLALKNKPEQESITPQKSDKQTKIEICPKCNNPIGSIDTCSSCTAYKILSGVNNENT
jgi:recombinational DNA repair protein RecR